jgi:predicted enzyme related to lactoylglutathione lyase
MLTTLKFGAPRLHIDVRKISLQNTGFEIKFIRQKKQSMKTVEIIMIPVTDRQKAKEFYLKLGFDIIIEAPDPHGETWIQMGLPNSTTSISLASFNGIIIETDDIESEVEKFTAKGIEVGKIDNTPWGKFAWLKDLDGNSLCLHKK